MLGAIAWFARNHVAANLLMLLLVIGGLLTAYSIKIELFPPFSADVVQITVPYPGAAPDEVEEAICIRIEEEIYDIEGIEEVSSTAQEGAGVVLVEVERGEDPRRVLDDVKVRIDAIETFPEEAEKPVIQEIVLRQQVVNVAISGDVDRMTLKRLGESIRDDLAARDGITLVRLANAPPYEVSIEVSEDALRRYRLSLTEVADAVRRSSLDLPGGAIKTRGGEILVRTVGQAYTRPEFEELVLRSAPDGTRVRVGDVAEVIDGFEDEDRLAWFNGEPTVVLQVFRVGDQNALEVAAVVDDFIEEARARVPDGITIKKWADASAFLRGRLELLVRNGVQGLALVFLVLALFLRFRLAFWVSLGIPISFLGCLWLLPAVDMSINLLSLFAFIVVLGVVVDDAIVVGENIFRQHQRGVPGLEGAVRGAQEVYTPVTFAVLTSVAAFVPLLFLPGILGRFFRVIPLIVIPTLVFSWVESKLILPAHLAHELPFTRRLAAVPPFSWWGRFQRVFARGLELFAERVYQPFLDRALRWRYLTVAVAVAVFALVIGLLRGGFIQFRFFNAVEGDVVVSQLTMPLGTPVAVTGEAVARIEAAAEELQRELDERFAGAGESVVRHYYTAVGEQPYRTQQSQNGGGDRQTFAGAQYGEVTMELLPAERRENLGFDLDAQEVAKRWRELCGPIPGAEELLFSADIISAGDAINVRLAGQDLDQLRAAVAELEDRLAQYPGVYDVANSFREGKREIQLDIRPEAEALGLTLSDLARQVRQAFYGEEVQRIQRGRDEVKVMVRYPAADRRTLATLEDMRIRTPDGAEVPFSTVAEARATRGFASITRADRQRTISVTSDFDASDESVSLSDVVADLGQDVLPALVGRHPGVHWSFQGERKEQQETVASLSAYFLLALFVIYGLMAVPFRSYVQPAIVMVAIPFGLVGAVIGHLIMGFELSILSMCGIVALAGVVVNDSLVLVDYVNRHVRDGDPILEAATTAGAARFRPILLTSLTTFVGLTPLLLERSVQAQFLVPMAISLAFGVLFSTSITLLLVPSCYVILEDLKRVAARVVGRLGELLGVGRTRDDELSAGPRSRSA